MRGLRRYVLLGLLVMSCHFEGSCGKRMVNAAKAPPFVSGELEKQSGEKPTKVTCPTSIEAKKDATFTCTAEYPKATATVLIKQTSDKGDVQIADITGIVLGRATEETVGKTLNEKATTPVTVKCADRVYPAKPDSTYLCEATDASGGKATIEIRVKDDHGNISWRLKPPG